MRPPMLPSHPFESYTNRREPGQTVYIFGAGATASEGENVPLNSNLLAKSISADNPVDRSIKRNIKRFLDELYLSDKSRLPAFEEVFTYIDLAINKEKYFRNWQRDKLTALRNDLLLAAGSAITSTLPSSPVVHGKFVRALFRNKRVNNRNTSFISFNYDIMLDDALIPLQGSGRGDLDYGCYFRSFDVIYKDKRKRWEPPEQGKELFLLKPHGSFNWTWCPVCCFSRIYPEDNVALKALSEQMPCAKCHGRVESMLIPPAWLKNYNNANINNLWSIADFLTSQAEMMVFIGYSFSDADLELKFLLRRSLSQLKNYPRILVVTKSKKENNAMLRRYKSFFRNTQLYLEGFEKFATNPIHATNAPNFD